MNIPLNIDWQQILLHLLNFVILEGGLYLLLYKPVKAFMDKRTAYYRDQDAQAAKALADGGTVSRVYQNSLTEYAPEGDTAYIVTDTATLAALNVDYTVLRDYGDVFWAVRMNINDLTNNFNDDFVLPEAPQYGVGRRG